MGFLPFKTSWSDRVFIGIALMIAIGLLWLKFLEKRLSLWVALILSLALIIILVKYG